MKRLSIIRHATNKPITRLLQDAVDLLWDATDAERKLDYERIQQLKAETLALTVRSVNSCDDGRSAKA